MNQLITTKRKSKGTKEEKISLVLTYIKNNPSASRIDIAKNMELNPATVGRIMDDIISWHLLEYVGTGKSNGGRKPVCYNINPRAGYAIGLDITKRGVEAGLYDLTVKNKSKESLKFVKNRDFFEQLLSFIDDMMEKNKNSKILGVGVGMSGSVIDEVVKYTSVFEYRDVPLGEILKAHFTCPIIVEERVKCAAYACKASASTTEYKDIVYMQIGIGIGMGIILNGEIYDGGGSNVAGEIGHIVLSESGPLCHCGSRGCLEQFSSELAIIRDVTAGIEGGRTSLINEMTGGDISLINGNMIVNAGEMGDELCIEALNDACRYLAFGIYNMFMLLNPSKLIIKNNISDSNELISSFVYDNLKKLSVKMYNWTDKVIFEDDGDIVQRGSAQLIIDKMWDNPQIFYAT